MNNWKRKLILSRIKGARCIYVDGLQLQIDKIVCQRDIWWSSKFSVSLGGFISHRNRHSYTQTHLKGILKEKTALNRAAVVDSVGGSKVARKMVEINKTENSITLVFAFKWIFLFCCSSLLKLNFWMTPNFFCRAFKSSAKTATLSNCREPLLNYRGR